MDTGQLITVGFTLTFCFVFFGVFGFVMFWVYGFTPIFHWFIRSNGVPAKAVVLEVKKAGWGWDAGGRNSQSLLFQPVRVKLEVHPNNGMPYAAMDRFNAKPDVYRNKLKPGVEMQVAIARMNSQWVASLPETIVDTSAHQMKGKSQYHPTDEEDDDDPKARFLKLKDMLSSGLITQQEYDQKKKEILEEV